MKYKTGNQIIIKETNEIWKIVGKGIMEGFDGPIKYYDCRRNTGKGSNKRKGNFVDDDIDHEKTNELFREWISMSDKNKDDHLRELVNSLSKSEFAKEVMKNEEIMQAARDLKGMYDAYIEAGFTQQETMQLLTAMIMGGAK